MQQFIQHYSETPDIGLVVLLFVLDDFGRQVLLGPAHRVPLVIVVAERRAEAKVAQFDLPCLTEQDILGLDVSMYQIFRVNKLHCLAHLVINLQGGSLIKVPPLHKLEQVGVQSLQEYIQLAFVLKGAEQRHDVRMDKGLLQLDLASERDLVSLVGLGVVDLVSGPL